MARVVWFPGLLGIIFCFNNGVNCEPDITLLSRISNSDYKYMCIIGNNESDHSVVFLTPLSNTFLQIVSEYRTPEGKLIFDEFNCDFENECSKLFDNKNWETVQSANHLLPIINDIRFEKLYTERTQDNQISIDITEHDFYIPISLRAEEEPQVLLCTDGNEENIIQCYWIRIEQYQDSFEVAIRNCSKVNNQLFSIKDSYCILVNSTEHLTDLVRELDWFHFILLRNGNALIFKDAVTNKTYFTLTDIKYNIQKMYLKTSNGKKGEWKIHKNSYLKLKTFDSEVQLGSTFSTNNDDDNICISMMVSICQGCSLEIRVNNQTRQIYNGNSDIWQNIKLTAHNTQTNKFKIFVNGTRSTHSDILAIDNIRLCHEQEMRILTINNKIKQRSISCKALSYPTWYSTLNYTSRGSSEICEDAKYIGKKCNIPCSGVLGQSTDTEFCNKHIICKSSENYNVQNCVCAAGYRGPNCDEICKPNYFGYNCQKRCGQCKNNDTCLKSSGFCLKGCKNEYVPDMCIFKFYEPINLSGTVNENGQVELSWIPPKYNGSFKNYKIILSVLQSEINEKNPTVTKNVSMFDQNKCKYMLQKPVPLSSTYDVKVCGKGLIAHCANIILVSPPVKPKMTKNYITVEDKDNHSKVIKIPGIVKDTKSNLSNMYVTVCNETGINKKEIKFSNDSKILSLVVCSGTSWIASKLKTNTSEVTFIVGKEEKSNNGYNNPPLVSNNKYNICVVLINEYENQFADNVYCENNNTTSTFSAWKIVAIVVPVVLLLLVLTVGLCCYIKKRRDKRYCRHSGVNLENLIRID